MSEIRVRVINTLNGDSKLYKAGKNQRIKLKTGEILILGMNEFPFVFPLEDNEVFVERLNNDLTIVLSPNDGDIMILEDYFLNTSENNIAYQIDESQASFLQLSNAEVISTLSPGASLTLQDSTISFYHEANFKDYFDNVLEKFDTTALISLGVIGGGYGIYALTRSDDEDNAPAADKIVLAPKDLLLKDITLANYDKNDKLLNEAGTSGEINTLTPTLSGSKSSGTAGHEIIIELTSGKKLTTTVKSDGSWQIAIPEKELKATDKGVFKIYEKNESGSTSKPVEVKYSIDLVAPEKFELPTIDNASAEGAVNIDKPTIRGANAEAGATVQITDPNGTKHTVLVNQNGDWVFQFPDLKMTEGLKKEISVAIIDAAGNQGKSFTIPIILDKTAPVAPIMSDGAEDNVGPVKGLIKSKGWTDDNQPLFTGTANIADAGSEIIAVIDGQIIKTKTPVIIEKNGTWSYQFETAIADGYRKIEFKVKDPAGNFSVATPSYYLNIDTAAFDETMIKNIAIKAGNTAIKNSGLLKTDKASITGQSDLNIEKVTIYQLVDGDYKKIGDALVDSRGSWSLDISKNLTNGDNTLAVVPTTKTGIEVKIENSPNIYFKYQPATTINDLITELVELEVDMVSAFSTLASSQPIDSAVQTTSIALSFDEVLVRDSEDVFVTQETRLDVSHVAYQPTISNLPPLLDLNYVELQ